VPMGRAAVSASSATKPSQDETDTDVSLRLTLSTLTVSKYQRTTLAGDRGSFRRRGLEGIVGRHHPWAIMVVRIMYITLNKICPGQCLTHATRCVLGIITLDDLLRVHAEQATHLLDVVTSEQTHEQRARH
jgi:hypothetical protein